MSAIPHIILAVSLLLTVGCVSKPSGLGLQDALARSLPHDASITPPGTGSNYTYSLTAEGTDWTVTVRWNPGELNRWVKWQEGNDGFTVVIPLRTRPAPFTQSFWGLTMTLYGPYQPACVHRQRGDDWHVMMGHEQADFPTEKDLVKMLERSIPGQLQAHPVLSPDGIMVTLRGPSCSRPTALDVEILILTVNGRTPSPSLLKPFLTGKVVIEPNQSMICNTTPQTPTKTQDDSTVGSPMLVAIYWGTLKAQGSISQFPTNQHGKLTIDGKHIPKDRQYPHDTQVQVKPESEPNVSFWYNIRKETPDGPWEITKVWKTDASGKIIIDSLPPPGEAAQKAANQEMNNQPFVKRFKKE